MTQKKGGQWAKVGPGLEVPEINEQYMEAARRRSARLFPVSQILQTRPGNIGHFGGGVKIHQFFIELLGMRYIPLVFFKGSRFKQLSSFLVGTPKHYQTKGT